MLRTLNGMLGSEDAVKRPLQIGVIGAVEEFQRNLFRSLLGGSANTSDEARGDSIGAISLIGTDSRWDTELCWNSQWNDTDLQFKFYDEGSLELTSSGVSLPNVCNMFII